MLIKSKKDKFNITLCKTILSHFIGLMFALPKNDGLLFEFKKEKSVALHMLFVFITIDIVYINKDKKVVKILKRVKPFTPYIKPIKCKYILEVKNAKNLQLNDKINF